MRLIWDGCGRWLLSKSIPAIRAFLSVLIGVDTLVLLGHFLYRVEVLVKNLVHREHMYAVLFEDGAHCVVAADLPFVGWVLEVAFFHIFPDFLYRLRP
jgi:hypothetical protein